MAHARSSRVFKIVRVLRAAIAAGTELGDERGLDGAAVIELDPELAHRERIPSRRWRGR
jgi:hypothetical protein